MKRVPLILLAAALSLTACTDQPASPESNATATETMTLEPTESEVTDETVVEAIAEVLEHPDPGTLPAGDEARGAFTELLLPEPDQAEGSNETAECPPVTATQPVAAGFGSVTHPPENDEPPNHDALAAFIFDANDDAETFTDQVQHFAGQCSAHDYAVEVLTHHTDEAFEIQVELPGESASSLVILRNEKTVLMAASSPPTDVALALTLADQLDEMLR